MDLQVEHNDVDQLLEQKPPTEIIIEPKPVAECLSPQEFLEKQATIVIEVIIESDKDSSSRHSESDLIEVAKNNWLSPETAKQVFENLAQTLQSKLTPVKEWKGPLRPEADDFPVECITKRSSSYQEVTDYLKKIKSHSTTDKPKTELICIEDDEEGPCKYTPQANRPLKADKKSTFSDSQNTSNGQNSIISSDHCDESDIPICGRAYQADAVLDRKMIGSSYYYKIKPKDFSEHFASWEPMINLGGVFDLVIAFEKANFEEDQLNPHVQKLAITAEFSLLPKFHYYYRLQDVLGNLQVKITSSID